MDTLINRIANVRTWTYVSHRSDWVLDAASWQERTRALEDRLSDALHERLTQRFVDRRTAVLVRRLRDSDDLVSAVARSGEVMVEGQFVGRLEGFRFHADQTDGANAARAVAAAASRALKHEIASRVAQVAAEPDGAFALDDQGMILWREAAVARMIAGPEVLRPAVELFSSDLIEATAREALQRRLTAWLEGFLNHALANLFTARRAPLSGAARGLAFQLGEALGSLPRFGADAQVAALTAEDRRQLARLDIRLGVESIFLPTLLKPAAQRLRGLLWAIHAGLPPLPAPPPGRVSVLVAADVPPGYYAAIGYRVMGMHAVRVDMVERFAAELRKLARLGPFAVPPPLVAMLGVPPEQSGGLLAALGYRAGIGPTTGSTVYTLERRRPNRGKRRLRENDESPFAALRRLTGTSGG
jgi:ATP-dependent RNA helicase SUPV3L1/SUV3